LNAGSWKDRHEQTKIANPAGGADFFREGQNS
jgi:hypothetical protein